MAVRKPKELRSITNKELKEADLKRIISEILAMPTSDVLYLMNCDDSDNQKSIIEMAITRCAYLGYFDGDVKRLEWLLNKMGIKDVSQETEKQVDLGKITNDTILRALNVKGDSNGSGKANNEKAKKEGSKKES